VDTLEFLNFLSENGITGDDEIKIAQKAWNASSCDNNSLVPANFCLLLYHELVEVFERQK
jgi:hypothetical protein